VGPCMFTIIITTAQNKVSCNYTCFDCVRIALHSDEGHTLV